jgi:hypothetical protein
MPTRSYARWRTSGSAKSAKIREIFVNESQSQVRLGGPGVNSKQVGPFARDQFLDIVPTRPALEFAAERTIGGFGAGATAPGGGPDVVLANRIAAA